MATELIGNIKGVKGETGATPQISIGTVTTLPTGEAARATMTGTVDYPLLNLGLPRGAKGDTGEVTTEQMDEAIATAEATVRPISAGGTGQSVLRYNISSAFTATNNIVKTGANQYSITAYYYPYEHRCYFRLYATLNATLDANTEYKIGTFNDYIPTATYIFSARAYNPVNYADIDADGGIYLKTASSQLATNYKIYITGWWFYEG